MCTVRDGKGIPVAGRVYRNRQQLYKGYTLFLVVRNVRSFLNPHLSNEKIVLHEVDTSKHVKRATNHSRKNSVHGFG